MKFRFHIMKTLYLKEMTDILRDRKTLLMMILLPVVLYPLLFFLGIYIMSSTLSGGVQTYVLGASSLEGQEILEEGLADYEGNYQINIVRTNPEAGLADVKVNALLFELEDGSYELQYDSSDTASSAAASIALTLLDSYKQDKTAEMIEAAGLDAETILNPVTYTKSDQASSEDTMGYLLGMILPFLLIASILMGALYPAIDVTAGEKERGTLETLLTLPISNMELLSGKFLAVATISIISALLNILSMGGSSLIWYMSMMSSLGQNTSILRAFLPAMGIMAVCMVIFAIMISAMLLCICINTSSFKEAQNMTTPIMLVVMVLGMGGMMQNVTLKQVIAIPVVNISVLLRDVFSFQFDWPMIGLVLGINLLYAFVVMIMMSRIYHKETILFSDGMAGIKFFHNRKHILKKEGTVPGFGDVVILLGTALMLILTVGTYLETRFEGVGLLGIQAICLILPLFLAWYMKCDMKKVFSLVMPKKPFLSVLGGVVLWAGVYLVILSVAPVIARIFPASTQSLETTDEYLKNMNPVLLILVVGIAPGICEEIFFRGFLFGTVREKTSKADAMIFSALLFGLYHMSLSRFFTTATLGLANAFALACTGSIFVPMLMHMLNNSVSCLAYILPESWADKLAILNGTFASTQQEILVGLVGALVAICGIFLLVLSGRKARAKG